MPKNLTASDRKTLIRLASSMEKGSEERRVILAGLEKTAGGTFNDYMIPGLKKFNEATATLIARMAKSRPYTDEMDGEEDVGGFMEVGPILVVNREGVTAEVWLRELYISPDYGDGKGEGYIDGDSILQWEGDGEPPKGLTNTGRAWSAHVGGEVGKIRYKTPQRVAAEFLASLSKDLKSKGWTLSAH